MSNAEETQDGVVRANGRTLKELQGWREGWGILRMAGEAIVRSLGSCGSW